MKPLKITVTAIIILLFSFMLPALGQRFDRRDLRIPYYRQKADDATLAYIERLRYLDSIAGCKKGAEKARIYYKMGEMAFNNFDFNRSAKFYESAFREFPADSVRMRSLAAGYVSKSWFRQYKFRETLKWSNVVLKIAKPDSLIWIDMNEYAALSAVADRYNLSTLFSELITTMEKKLEKLQRSSATPDRKALGMARYENTVGNYRTLRGDFESALGSYIRASEATTDSATYYTAMINIGNVYCNMGQPELGRPILEDVVKHRCSQQLIAAIDLCNGYLMMNMPDSAESILKRYIEPAQIPKESGLTHFPPLIRADIAHLRGDLETAYDNMIDGHITLRESFIDGDYLFAGEIDRSIREAADITVGDKWYRRPGQLGWAFILLLAVEMLIIFLAVALIRREKKRDGDRAKRMEERYNLLVQKAAAAEREDKLYRERCKNDNLTVENLRMRELIHSIEQQARTSRTLPALSGFILGGIKDMNTTTTTIGTRMTLHEQTDHDFMKILCERHPDLTKAEREICAYAHMGFSPKEIAATTNRSIKTVNTLRHRVRSKIGIPPEISLDAYLLKLDITRTDPPAA